MQKPYILTVYNCCPTSNFVCFIAVYLVSTWICAPSPSDYASSVSWCHVKSILTLSFTTLSDWLPYLSLLIGYNRKTMSRLSFAMLHLLINTMKIAKTFLFTVHGKSSYHLCACAVGICTDTFSVHDRSLGHGW